MCLTVLYIFLRYIPAYVQHNGDISLEKIIPNCAASGFAEMELGRQSRREKYVGQIVKYWNRIMSLAIADPVTQFYGWQKRNIRVRSWTMELKEELYNTGLAFVWTKQQECDLREITKIVRDRRNNIERQNILEKL
jgi:hypothetical protein